MYTHFLHLCGQCTHIGGRLECVSGKCTLWVSSHQHIIYNYRMWTCFSVRLKHLLGATCNWLYLCCTSLCSNVAMFLAYIRIRSIYICIWHKCTRDIAKTHMSFICWWTHLYDAILHHCITTFFPGATPYEDLSMATLLAQIISGYRLPMPELASDKMWVSTPANLNHYC